MVEKLVALTNLLDVLQKGRAIPDRNGKGTVFESKDNMEEIAYVKDEIVKLIEIHV